MVATFMRQQEIAIGRIACRRLRTDLYDCPPVRFDQSFSLRAKIGQNNGFYTAERIVEFWLNR